MLGTSCKSADTNLPESPATDFEYEENADGGITITKYIGSESAVRIPEKINNINVIKLGELSFSDTSNLERVIIPNSVTDIDRLAFWNLKILKKVTFSNQLKTIGDGAFEYCEKLTDVKLPDTLVSIGPSAFKDCGSITDIHFPKSLKSLGDNVFARSGLVTVTFENGLDNIPYSAFAVTKIRKIELPSSIKSIGGDAFARCPDLESVILNEGVKAIDDLAFSGNPKLKEIVIPSTVTDINETAFEQCDALKSVKFEGNAPSNYNYESNIPMYYPEYTVYYHDGATGFTSPEWCGYKTEKW